MSLDTLRKAFDRHLGNLLALLMGAMVLDVLWGVASRFILRDPSSMSEEVARYLLIWVGLLGAAGAAGRRMHLAIDLLPSVLSERPRRLLALLLEGLVFLVSGVVLVWGGSGLMKLTLDLGQTSALGIPLGAIYFALPLAGFIMMFYSALAMLGTVETMQNPETALQSPNSN